jgi:hypothetical protein
MAPRAKSTAVASSQDSDVAITIKPPQMVEFEVRIVGETPLIMHAWSEKAKLQMRQKQQGQKASKKEPKVPRDEYNGGRLFDVQGRDCIKAMCFKNAIVDTASFVDNITKVSLRGSVFVLGDLIPIEHDGDPTSKDRKEPFMREDMVRVGMGVADIRYRPEYRNWSCKLRIRHLANTISTRDVITLLSTAGTVNGLGECRPQKTGDTFGTFRVETLESA